MYIILLLKFKRNKTKEQRAESKEQLAKQMSSFANCSFLNFMIAFQARYLVDA
jgi:hypothetical protein